MQTMRIAQRGLWDLEIVTPSAAPPSVEGAVARGVVILAKALELTSAVLKRSEIAAENARGREIMKQINVLEY